jgi:hypothetical protein
MKNKLVLFLLLFLTLVSEIKAQTDKDKKSRSVGCLNVSSVAIDISIFCAGKSQLLTAVPTNGGQTPFYNWTLNDVSIPVFSNTTTDDGLGSNTITDVYVTGNYVYASTSQGLSISDNSGTSFSTKTKSANNLGNDLVRGMFVGTNKIYVATAGGLSISEDGGASFDNKTTTDGLGSNVVNDVFVDATNSIYAATSAGLSISNDAGLTFTNIAMSNVRGVFVDGISIYAATSTGLNISNDGGASFSLKTTTDGLGNNNVNDIFKVGSIIYAATSGGLSISSDGGLLFSNKTTADGLINNNVSSAFAIGDFIYASTAGGLSMSNDTGSSFIVNKTALDGFGTNTVNKTFALGNKIFAATTGGLAITNITTLQVNNAEANDVYTVTMFPSYVACSGSQPVTNSLTISPLPQPSITTNSPICKDVTLTLNGSNLRTSTSNTYQWKDPNDNSSTDKDLSFPNSSVERSGSYKLIVTDVNGCVDSTSKVITVRSLPNPLVGYNPNVCAETTIKLTSSDSRNPNFGSYTYSWTGNGFASPSGLQNPEIANATVGMSGVYNLTMTDVSLCSATASINVTVYSIPTPTVSYNPNVCAETTIKLTSSDSRNPNIGPYTYSWTGNGFASPNTLQNPEIANATVGMSGVYNLTMTDASLCSATASINVIVHSLPTPTVGYNPNVCAETTIKLTSSDTRNPNIGPYTYSWTGNGFASPNGLQNPEIANATVGMSGVYNLSMTDVFLCSATASINVTVHSLPTPTVGYNPNVCAETTIKLTSSDTRNPNIGPYTYSWTGNGFTSPNTLQNPEIANATVGMSGVYNLTMKDVFLCSATASINVTVHSLPTPTVGYNPNVCAETTIKLTSSDSRNPNISPYTYSWTGNGFTSPNTLQNPEIANATVGMSGVYNLTMKDVFLCSATASINVIVHSLPTPTVGYNPNVCAETTIKLTSSDTRNPNIGPYTYSWTGSGFASSNGLQNPEIANATVGMSGVYNLTMTDVFLCSATASINVIVHSLPTPTVSYNPNVCAETTIKLTSSDTRNPNIGPYTYSWTGNGFTSPNTLQNPEIANATVGMSGVYNLTMTDVFLCSATASINVSVYSLPTPVAVYNDTVCVSTDLNLLVTDIRDTGDEQTPYTYLWTGNAFSPGPTSLPISKNGLKEPNFPNATQSMSGKYNVTVTDKYGCMADTSLVVAVHSLPQPIITYNDTVCALKTLNLFVTDNREDDFSIYSYTWRGPENFSSSIQNPSRALSTIEMTGTYHLSMRDTFGCVDSTSKVNVTVHSLPTPTVSYNPFVCAEKTIKFTSSDTRDPNIGPYTYSWTGSGFASPNGLQNAEIANATVGMSGVYNLTMTDVFLCSATASINVSVYSLPIPEAVYNDTVCAGTDLNLLVTDTRDTGDEQTPYTYLWTGNAFSPGPTSLPISKNGLKNPIFQDATPSMSGKYNVTVGDQYGCTATTSVDVVVHSVPIPNAVYNIEPVCVGKILNLDVSDGRPTNDQHPAYAYRWSGPAFGSVPASVSPESNLKNPIFDPATKAMEGKYYVTVTDIFKCSASTNLDVLIHTLPIPSTSSNSPVCSAETLNLYANDTRAPQINPYTYSWSGPNNYTSNDQNPIFNSVSVSLTGVYSVTISDNFGCTATANTEVVNHHPIATASNDGPYEEGENVNLLATGGTRFDWTGPNGFTSNLVNPSIPNGKTINSGIYSVTVTYQFCTATAITPVNIACSSPALSYYLAYADMAVPEIITPLSANMLVQKSTRPMTVIAIPSCSSPTIESIQLQLSGVGNNHFYVDNNARFSLFETAGNLSGEVWVPTVYTFIARAFDQDNASGNVIIGPDNIQFRIINGNSTIIQPALSSNSVCAGSSITLTSDTTGAYEVGNIYQAYLSNKDGNFDDPVLIGSSADPKTINCIIPNYVSGGSNYKVMVRSSAPIVSTVSVATLNIAPAALVLSSPNNNLVNSNKDQKAIYTIEATNKISGTSTINYKAQYNVTLKPGFEANNGTVFLAEIGDACNEDR